MGGERWVLEVVGFGFAVIIGLGESSRMGTVG